MSNIDEIDALDAAVFSGDLLETKAGRKELAEYIARWERALAEAERSDFEEADDEPDEDRSDEDWFFDMDGKGY